jgi:lipase maturation factor 1
VVLMLFLPRRARLICFFIVTPWEIGVILTANYTFLNYLVLSLGFLLLDDSSIRRLLPQRFRNSLPEPLQQDSAPGKAPLSVLESSDEVSDEVKDDKQHAPRGFASLFATARLFVAAILLSWIGYATTAEMIRMLWSDLPLPTAPIVALEPFRIANQYGLFAVMTRGRYEIEFQGSNDGQNWTPYLFRYKPQAPNEAPGIYAPYQPRFEWNLWFASLGDWQQSNFVALTEERLLENDPSVLGLFKANPFPQSPPRYVKAVLWQYWFTSMEEKQHTGNWWKRNLLGLYAPVVTRQQDGKFNAVEWPEPLAPHG